MTISDGECLRVLLVEDSALLASRLAELIVRLPHVQLVDTVDSEAAALEAVTALGPEVLILDLHLRSGTGFGVLRALARRSQPRPKVIVLTNFGLPQFKLEAEALGADAFLDKSREYYRLPALLSGMARDQVLGQPG
jgi:DNA-binding NarL/FixJ family response regulator